MRRLGAIVVCGVALGCSSSSSDPFGPTPDFAHVEAQFSTPTGTFTKGSESSVVAGLAQQRSSSSNGFGIGGAPAPSTTTQSAGGLQLQTLKALDANGGTSFCAALQSGAEQGSCSCPNGGTLAYDLSGMKQMQGYNGGPIDVTIKVRASACAVQGGSVDGTEFAEIKSSGTPNAQDLMMLFDVHLTVSAAGQTERLDADFEYMNGKFWFSIALNDGNVVVGSETWDSATKSGTLVIKDRSETWTCVLSNGKGTCTSDHGGSRAVDGL